MSKIQLEDCQILAHYTYAGEQKVLTLASEKIPQLTQAGQFVHISVDESLKMRRPISIMSVDTDNNTFDLLYKVVGIGTQKLAHKQIGESLSVLGPIGNEFNVDRDPTRTMPLLIGGGVGMPPMIAIAQTIQNNPLYNAFAILASEVEFPFEVTTSALQTACSVNATYGLLEEWGVATRLASTNEKVLQTSGIFNGYATDLARKYLKSLSTEERAKVEIYSCGPTPMLKSVKQLANEFDLPSQLSLEEHMACAVGGCAGCVVKTVENGVEKMQRVCVDGPVFDGNIVFNE
jgi:dihydroorotate dehydrogenase electron transfer subunit